MYSLINASLQNDIGAVIATIELVEGDGVTPPFDDSRPVINLGFETLYVFNRITGDAWLVSSVSVLGPALFLQFEGSVWDESNMQLNLQAFDQTIRGAIGQWLPPMLVTG